MSTAVADAPTPALLTGWGRTAPSRARLWRPRDAGELSAALVCAGRRGAIARGLGRSYGDAAQNAGGDVLSTTGLERIHAFDAERGLVTVDAGASLDRLMRITLPRGWFIPVTPGTRQVTVGGAIAADIHGKNHHRDGSFCHHVDSLVLLTPAGEQRTITQSDDDLFAATAGGMGLTGVILRATLRLIQVETSAIRADTERAGDIDEALTRIARSDVDHRYSVAWIDCLARGARLGRAVLSCGDHAAVAELEPRARAAPLARLPATARVGVPSGLPAGLLRPAMAGVFNELWFRRAPRREHARIVPLGSFFHPLDGIRDWNRLYGPGGLIQYQFVVPAARADLLRLAIERLQAARCPVTLAVLKRFGPQRGLLSFPIAGWTLALDMPARAPGLARALDELDELVAEAGGRVYLAKDGRLRPELLAAMYPRLPEWRAIRARIDPLQRLRSDLARRLEL